MNVDMYTDKYHIRSLIPSDKDDYMQFYVANSKYRIAYEENSRLVERTWEEALKGDDEIHMMVFLLEEPEEVFVGTCSVGDNGDRIEIGYNVLEEYRNHGIATEVARTMIEFSHQHYPSKDVVIRTRAENKASQRVAEKCGGVLYARESSEEAKLTMSMLEKYGHGEQDSTGDRLTPEMKKQMEEIVEAGKESIFVYRMP